MGLSVAGEYRGWFARFPQSEQQVTWQPVKQYEDYMEKKYVLAEARKELSLEAYRIFNHLIEHLLCNDAPTTYDRVGQACGFYRRGMDDWLGEISTYTYKKFGFMLTAMVWRLGWGQPGLEFANLAASLGVNIPSRLWYDQECSKMVSWARALT